MVADRGRAPARVRAAALWARAMLPSVSLDQAGEDAADALALYARADDRAGMALCLAALSSVHEHRGEHASAMAAADRRRRPRRVGRRRDRDDVGVLLSR